MYSCTHWLRPRNSPPFPAFGLIYMRAVLVSQDRRHLLVTPCPLRNDQRGSPGATQEDGERETNCWRGRGWVWSQVIIRQREGLVLYKLFNTLWGYRSPPEEMTKKHVLQVFDLLFLVAFDFLISLSIDSFSWCSIIWKKQEVCIVLVRLKGGCDLCIY